jgi:methyltransferase (TIGR00027 family)
MTESAEWDIASGVGQTALATAACRAVETLRENPLVRDPYAAAFVLAARGPALPLPVTWEEADSDEVFPWPAFVTYTGVRSRFLDEFLTAACGAGTRQVVILAAGLDTRAYRLDWPDGLVVYEVDVPRVLEFKDQILTRSGAAPCVRHMVAADLREDWPAAIRAAGFNPEAPTAWLAEGLLPYLDDEAKASLFGAVGQMSAPGSQIAIDHNPASVSSLRTYTPLQAAIDERGVALDPAEIWRGEHHEDPVARMASLGWAVSVTLVADAAREYGRPLSEALPESMLGTLLITARVGSHVQEGQATDPR